jgi:anti-sigma28 factor (negative regulator of flagellin synthesis)
MRRPTQPPLNRSRFFRYDGPHLLESSDEEFPVDAPAEEASGREDMEVRGVSSLGGSSPIVPSQPAVRPEAATKAAGPAAPQDEVEISSAGRLLDNLGRTGNIRDERLAQIRAAIENGTYDTTEKLDGALSRLLDENEIDQSA